MFVFLISKNKCSLSGPDCLKLTNSRFQFGKQNIFWGNNFQKKVSRLELLYSIGDRELHLLLGLTNYNGIQAIRLELGWLL